MNSSTSLAHPVRLFVALLAGSTGLTGCTSAVATSEDGADTEKLASAPAGNNFFHYDLETGQITPAGKSELSLEERLALQQALPRSAGNGNLVADSNGPQTRSISFAHDSTRACWEIGARTHESATWLCHSVNTAVMCGVFKPGSRCVGATAATVNHGLVSASTSTLPMVNDLAQEILRLMERAQ